ncbi:MAG: ABC transporter ATP-binding protein [bacterium]|nr:ABC transporter ATP-binding protein [bacterium]
MAITPIAPAYNGLDTGAIIRAEAVSKGFNTGGNYLRVLNNVSLIIPRGQFVAVMGPSGSGKSTLLYLLGGLDRADQGRISVAGRVLDDMSGEDLAHYRGRTIGFVFQSFYLVPTLTALENVALPGVFAGASRDEREGRAVRLLTKLGMADRLDHRPSQLSGGQQQRVAIARAMFNNPPIIMCDEPTGALDSKTGQTVMEMLRAFCTRQGKTIVVVTHDPNVATYADRMIKIRDGQIEEDSPTERASQLRSPLQMSEEEETNAQR